ncbi:FemAB family PEP-CTERM system-associated protein [Pseudomonadales bacterium]|nr:FemAB family PEP-CTERM system-associated protein [Pseudomonadales bacterium]
MTENKTHVTECIDGSLPSPQANDKETFFSPQRSSHCSEWSEAITKGLSLKTILLKHNDEFGFLPLSLVSSPFFGRFLISTPYLNTGGVWARTDAAALELIDRACELADKYDVRYLELRHEHPIQHQALSYQRSDKVHMRLALPSTDELLLRSYKSKLRSQIKKCGTHGHVVHWGHADLLDEFYRVFSINMRDLGTPVFPRRLFAAILKSFGTRAEICVVRNNGTPVASALLIHNQGITELPSASSLRAWNHTGPNMLMYQRLLERAIEKGSHSFDFGRSSIESGTYRFKKQWGAVASPAPWQYYVRKGSPTDMRPDSEGKRRLIKTWQKLPVWLTKIIGPPIIRGIP